MKDAPGNVEPGNIEPENAAFRAGRGTATPTGTATATQPAVVDRATWQAQLDDLLVREKAHTREGDAIAAARRRLPMVEIDPAIPLIGERGPVRLADVFEGRRQLIVYFHMWPRRCWHPPTRCST